MKVLDLFSGIGGFSLGLHRAGMETVAFCEIEPYPQAVLRKNFPGVPIYDDVRTITAERLRADGIATVELICGGFPCQPFSSAGKHKGTDDHRYLWPEMLRIIDEFRPRWVIGENSPNVLNVAFSEIKSGLEGIGYEVGEPLVIPACAVGADHRRHRAWICAHSDESRLQGCSTQAVQGFALLPEQLAGVFEGERSRRSISEPRMLRGYHGVSAGVDRIKALGNTVMPQIPEIIGRAIMAADARVI